MAAVDKTSLNSAPWDIVISILENCSYIKDPRRRAGDRSRTMIYKHSPDATSFDFSAYPYIVAQCPIKTKSKQSADQSTQEIQWTQTIIIRASMDGSGNNKNDIGVSDMVSIMDNIDQYFESTSVRKDFKQVKLNFQDINTISAMNELEYDGKIIYETTYEITYRSRICVK